MPKPYPEPSGPAPRSVSVTVLVLTRDEEVNIACCLASVAWARQIIVVDSGSTDGTVNLATAAGADVVQQDWLGFGGQRAFALALPQIMHDWVYFVDADEWVSGQLAHEISTALEGPDCSAFEHRFRLIFQGTWIRHCGWYTGSWITRLMRREDASFAPTATGERPMIRGRTRQLRADLVNEDQKGLASWLNKHVEYARLDANAGLHSSRFGKLHHVADDYKSGSLRASRACAKALYLIMPFRSTVMFTYMYILRAGFLDGKQGLRFCLYQAWFRMATKSLAEELESSH